MQNSKSNVLLAVVIFLSFLGVLPMLGGLGTAVGFSTIARPLVQGLSSALNWLPRVSKSPSLIIPEAMLASDSALPSPS